jgi:hypothetical protein
MGEFTQNLLKLTEFPFSYSLMGLLALIFGQGTGPEDLSWTMYLLPKKNREKRAEGCYCTP